MRRLSGAAAVAAQTDKPAPAPKAAVASSPALATTTAEAMTPYTIEDARRLAREIGLTSAEIDAIVPVGHHFVTSANITPAIADKILEHTNTGNRARRSTQATKYARDIKEGRWEAIPDGLSFGRDGRLGNGQHRSAAISLAERDARFTITFGLTEQEIRNIDIGLKRTFADAVQFDRGEKLPTWWNGMVKRFLMGVNKAPDGGYSNEELLRFIEPYNDELLFACDAVCNRMRKHVVTSTTLAVLARAAQGYIDRNVIRTFAAILIDGEHRGETPSGVIIKLREKLRKNTLTADEVYSLTARALIHYKDGKNPSTLPLGEVKDPFPLRK